MPVQCPTVTLTSSVTVADGAFAPGHLGELTRQLPFELVDDVLKRTGGTQRRLRLLPSRVGVHFILALALFPQLGYVRVWDKLAAGLRGLLPQRPSEKALREVRRRLGIAPLRLLFETLAGPVAQPVTPGVRYRCWRTVAFDGCSSTKAPDRPRVCAWLGKHKHRYGTDGYPMLKVMVLCETGTRALLGAVFGPKPEKETGYAEQLLPLLNDTMLLLNDRGKTATWQGLPGSAGQRSRDWIQQLLQSTTLAGSHGHPWRSPQFCISNLFRLNGTRSWLLQWVHSQRNWKEATITSSGTAETCFAATSR